jgi:AraC-like DNA-binding protein
VVLGWSSTRRYACPAAGRLNVSDDLASGGIVGRRTAFGQDVISAAQAVQSYRERVPVPQLAGLVSSVWIQQVAADGPAYEHRTVPNGSAALSYALGDDAIALSGPQRSPTVESLAPGATVVGIRFRPGVAPSLLGAPTSELVDLRVEADRLWGRRSASLAGRLAEAVSPEAAVRLLEHELVRRSRDVIDADPLVTAAIGRLQPWRPDDVGTWAAGMFISARQLHRRFVAALGYGPKTFQRIRRFQGFLALSQVRRSDHGSLARLARESGYADQAHLTRESSELTGLTPRAFLEEMWQNCGPNHDHEASYAGLRRALLAARN